MLFDVRHSMLFEYSGEAFIEPLTVRLTPRVDSAQEVLRSSLSIEPKPAGISRHSDIAGNSVTLAWFEGAHRQLRLVAEAQVRTLRTNPFEFLLEPDAEDLPVAYLPQDDALASVYLSRDGDPQVEQFALDVRKGAAGSTTAFLEGLAHRLRKRFTVIERADGDPWPAGTTLARETGACRDLTVLFMEACRVVGLAARFVSGYWLPGGDDNQPEQIGREDSAPELHAWAEVYLPGAGWRGWDPTMGLAVSDEHIALAAGPTPQLAAPTSGSIRGDGVTSTLTATIEATREADGTRPDVDAPSNTGRTRNSQQRT